jgi:hypothetical protein
MIWREASFGHAWFHSMASFSDDNIKSLSSTWLSVAVIAAAIVIFPLCCGFCRILPSVIVVIDWCIVSVVGIVSSSCF